MMIFVGRQDKGQLSDQKVKSKVTDMARLKGFLCA